MTYLTDFFSVVKKFWILPLRGFIKYENNRNNNDNDNKKHYKYIYIFYVFIIRKEKPLTTYMEASSRLLRAEGYIYIVYI